MQAADRPQLTVWFDAECPLCTREIALMRRLDKRSAIQFVSVQTAQGCPIEREALLARLHARDDRGRLLSGAAAFAAMWRAIPLLRPFGLAAQWPPVLRFLDWGYGRFLRLRPYLQRWVRSPRR